MRATHRLRLATILATALAVAACGPAAPASISPTSAPPLPTIASTPTPEPTATPAPTPEATNAATPPAPGGDLAALVPDEVLGDPLTKTAVEGDALDDLPAGDQAAFQSIIDALGIEPSALHAVLAEGDTVSIIAIRVDDTDPRGVGDAFIGALNAFTGNVGQIDDVTVGGKAVKRMTASTFTGAFYVYVTADAMFAVGSNSEDQGPAEAAIALLP